MRVVIQRVSEAQLYIDGSCHASIANGLVILVGIEEEDTTEDSAYLVGKIPKLRIFNDAQGVMNLSVTDIGGELLVVSQFTLHALTKKGNRPSYIKACKGDKALKLYHTFVEELQKNCTTPIQTGIFGADMKVHLCNDGPVTILMDSKQKE